MQKRLCPSPGGMTLAIAQALPLLFSFTPSSDRAKGHLTGSPTFRHILFSVMPSLLAAEMIFLCTYAPLANTELFGCTAPLQSHPHQQQRGQNETKRSICFNLLPHPHNAMPCVPQHVVSHIQETSQHVFHPTPAILLELFLPQAIWILADCLSCAQD